MKMELEICLSPSLYPYYRGKNDTVIIVDVFRASATICSALSNGATAVIPVADIEEARRYKQQGFLVGAERNAKRCDFADFGNSPFDYSPEIVAGKELVFTTTNGTQALHTTKDARHLWIGTFSNMDALVNRCIEMSKRVVIVCAGWNNRVNVEDTLFGGAFVENIRQRSIDITFSSDAVRMAQQLWEAARENPKQYLRSTEHYHRLITNRAERDIPYCLTPDTVSIVPYYDKEKGKLFCK